MIQLNALNFNLFMGVLMFTYLGYALLKMRRKIPFPDFGYICTVVENNDFLISWTAPNVTADSSTVSWTQAPIVKYCLKNQIGYSIPDQTTDILFDNLYKGLIVKKIAVQNMNSSQVSFSLVTRDMKDKNYIQPTLITKQGYSSGIVYLTLPTPIKYRLDQKSDQTLDQGGITIMLNTDGSSTPGQFYAKNTYICLVCEMDMSIS
jgi:hypothetical protein